MTITWQTPSGFLFSTSTGTSVTGVAFTATNATNYSVISGQLPTGLSLLSQGQLTGTIADIKNTTTSTFVIRASNTATVQDRTFSIGVIKSNTTQWSADTDFTLVNNSLKKMLVNKEYIDIQLFYPTDSIDQPLTYSIDRTTGRLPYGIKLDTTGRIYGTPKLFTLAPSQVESFSVDIVATDGLEEHRQNFVFDVIDSDTFSVDNTVLVLGGPLLDLISLDNTGTVSLSSLQRVEFNDNMDLGTMLANENAYISVTGFDPNPGKGPVSYRAVDTLPPHLSLDPSLGYLYGHLDSQIEYLHRYDFRISATKTDLSLNNTVISTGTFTLTVVNQYYDNVLWPNSNLGSLVEGLPSELAVTAQQTDSTWPLNYYLMPYSTLPQGLSLSTGTGHIIGAATTSGSFTFTVAVSTASSIQPSRDLDWPAIYVISTATAFNTFTVNVQPVSQQFTSIWAKPFLTLSQRGLWDAFIANDSIFLPELIYRADDPSFGIQTDLRIFLEFGIERVNLSDYAQSLYQNLYLRRLTFGSVKTAIARDSQGNHLYDAVYVDVVDNLEGAKSAITINGTTYYPGSIDNIRNTLESIVLNDNQEIAVDGYSLPKFMTTVASGQPYGYFKAAVLCYTLPGESPKIVNRIRSAKFNFDNLDFFIDRLVVQNSLDNTGTTYIAFNTQPIG
jgi:hypothetical protein